MGVCVCWLTECMVCVLVATESVIGRGCRPGSAMSLGSWELEEVLTVHWDSSRRCAQHGMAAVFSSTGEEPTCLHSRQTPFCHLVAALSQCNQRISKSKSKKGLMLKTFSLSAYGCN